MQTDLTYEGILKSSQPYEEQLQKKKKIIFGLILEMGQPWNFSTCLNISS